MCQCLHTDSVQPCLLGMSATPHLGIQILKKNGMPLIPVVSSQSGLAQVSQVKSVTILSKVCYVRVHIPYPLKVLGMCYLS